LVGLSCFAIRSHHPAGASGRNTKHFSTLSAIAVLTHRGTSVSRRDDDLSIRLGRIRDRGRNSRRPDTFIGEVMRAAKKAGHVGERFGSGTGGAHRSRFGRGRGAALSLSLHSGSRRVVTKARVVRHTGRHFRSAPLSNHVIYLKRDGVFGEPRQLGCDVLRQAIAEIVLLRVAAQIAEGQHRDGRPIR
jgi:hypothetical protein